MSTINADGRTEGSGSCLCGAVRYRVTEPLRPIIYCHCSQCRKTSGHFVAATAVARNELVVAADEDLRWFASSESASRGFCRRCGSSLFWLSEDRKYVCIMAGSLDDSDGAHAVGHIFVDDKPGYYELHDNLPQHSKGGTHGLRSGWPR